MVVLYFADADPSGWNMGTAEDESASGGSP
jgi:hypothetical protein